MAAGALLQGCPVCHNRAAGEHAKRSKPSNLNTLLHAHGSSQSARQLDSKREVATRCGR